MTFEVISISVIMNVTEQSGIHGCRIHVSGAFLFLRLYVHVY